MTGGLQYLTARGYKGLTHASRLRPSLIYQTAHLSRAAACYCGKRAQATRSPCLNALPCRRKCTHEIPQKTELKRVLRCLVFGVHRKDLGVSVSSLRDWIKQVEKRANPFPGSGNVVLTPEEAIMRKFERENRELREEVEILKKAAAYFAKNLR